MHHCGSICDIVVSMCFSPSDLFFLGKPHWTLELDSWIQNFMTWVIKMWFQPSNSHQSIHGVIRFVTFRNHIRNHTYGITLVHLHVFWFFFFFWIHITYTVYMESWLMPPHRLFKWFCWLKAVFIAVYWLCMFTCLYVGRWNIADLKINYNFGSVEICWASENICWANENICWTTAVPIYLPWGNWIEKKNSGPDYIPINSL